jgi:hypothetical protein
MDRRSQLPGGYSPLNDSKRDGMAVPFFLRIHESLTHSTHFLLYNFVYLAFSKFGYVVTEGIVL